MNRQGLLRASLMGEAPEITCAREEAWARWATTHTPLLSPSAFTVTGRHLNHFTVGSDPEMCFVDPFSGNRIEAIGCGLKVGLAAGCDQNERLVELRPWPSVSVVGHIAGILTALRWMHRVYYHHTNVFHWRSGAFFSGDGMGGHVHFGRKRPTRVEEVAALDGLARVFRSTGLFSTYEWDKRISGDRLGQVYGAPGDFRIQRHGYEYRSLPSWLQSPTVAFISVASSKLAVLDPTITTTWKAKEPTMKARNLLRGLAKLYKGRDDDAYVLYHLLTGQGDFVFEVNHGGDFAPAWGIPRTTPVNTAETTILPSCIKPTPEEITDMRNHLLSGIPLPFRETEPTFVSTIPRHLGYRWVPEHVTTGRHSGYGDLIHNLVQHRDLGISWDYSAQALSVNGAIPRYWKTHEIDLLRKFWPKVVIRPSSGDGTIITVPKPLCQTDTIAGLRAILLKSGLFPIWTVETVKKDSLINWMKAHPVPKPVAAWRTV